MDINYVYNDVFRKIRIELGYTQKEFAKLLNCTQAHVSYIERNERQLSESIKERLSVLYNLDLKQNFGITEKFRSVDSYKKYQKLVEYQGINKLDLLEELETLLEDEIIQNEFIEGEPLLIKNLCYATVECFLHNNYKKSIEYCLCNLGCNEDELYAYCPSTIKSPHIYSTISILAISCYMSGNFNLTLQLCNNIFEHCNNMWESDLFQMSSSKNIFKSKYLMFYIVYAFILLKEKDYSESLKICELALEKISDTNYIDYVVYILFIKYQALYMKGDMDSSREIFYNFEVFLKYLNFPQSIFKFANYDVEKFQKLFKTI